ncbi:DUF2784 domain-containing protein [Candidatus Aminicenantes bacterium AC-708-M15]|jgi:hypothetical protein|nr:DUF2784 domain-containing protein [SCandidatus Aminicenantes bacterium Aminicenantia_JdfR_composite]MCP2596659.1 DUF2784 domain-containing protein [Candidatus Aminicenantes bacterium AC-335-G13]MCP2603937.1 DUF2784 domain-containing protein [Candidatus Aminicenantes bacterium AC-708-M15]MCP2606356.1 DUF2784 domain-containing protein [Candidatus Aminicenantes bacterium AC-708-I09]MCP2618561.1 DUF2784 domain-containing protein [Candidatus Aminicenantes bacterium AC-335-A11]
MYYFLDKFFFVFHSSIIVFNLFGWIWKKTRLLNLITLLLTFFSWFFLGIWYGFGYCPCTDWHWQVREKLGYYDMPSSYLEFLIESITGLNVSSKLVDIFAVIFLLFAICISTYVNFRDFKRRK